MVGTLTLEGQVIDDEEAPVSGAHIWLTPGPRVATSNADGSFTFAGLAARQYSVAGVKDELFAEPIVVALRERIEPVTLRMHPGATLIVHVVADRKPVVGAKVVLDERREATTDSSGTARIAGLGSQYHDGLVTADGWALAYIGMFVGAEPGGVVEEYVALRRGALVSGLVVDPEGRRVREARVTVTEAAEGRVITHTTTENGVWRINALEAGKFSVTAASQGFASSLGVVLDCDGQTPHRGVVVRLTVGGQLSGVVLDDHGRPSQGAAVVAIRHGGHSEHTRTDSLGHFEFRGLELGPYAITASNGEQASRAVRATAENNKPHEVTLSLQNASIAGTVASNNGQPVAGAIVRAVARSRFSTTDRQTTTSDSRGHFDFGGLEPGEYIIEAQWPDQQIQREESDGVHAVTGNTDVRLTLAEAGTITGRVILDGKPMQSYGLHLLAEHDCVSCGGFPTGIRAPDGRFTLHNIEQGNWKVAFLGPGSAMKIVDSLRIQNGKVLDLGDVVMEHGQRVTGHVRDQTGAPVFGARVVIGRAMDRSDRASRLQQSFIGHYETFTNALGEYSFDGIDAPQRGTLIGAVDYRIGSSLLRVIPEGDASIDLVLLGSGTIEGSIEGFTGFDAFIDVIRKDEPWRARWMSVTATGRFRFDDLPAGDYTIQVESRFGVHVAPANVTVTPNEIVDVKLLMEHSRVRLKLKFPLGQWKDTALVRVNEPTQLIHPNLVTDDTVVFDQVEPGRYRVSTDGSTWLLVDVAASTTEQTIDLPASW